LPLSFKQGYGGQASHILQLISIKKIIIKEHQVLGKKTKIHRWPTSIEKTCFT